MALKKPPRKLPRTLYCPVCDCDVDVRKGTKGGPGGERHCKNCGTKLTTVVTSAVITTGEDLMPEVERVARQLQIGPKRIKHAFARC